VGNDLARAIAQRHLAIVLSWQLGGSDFATATPADQDYWLGVADEAVAAMEKAGLRFIVTIPQRGEEGGDAC
jgi:hypothetical protein